MYVCVCIIVQTIYIQYAHAYMKIIQYIYTFKFILNL